MHTSFFVTLAAASLCGLSAAAPTDPTPTQGKISTVVGNLDSSNSIDWTDTDSGARMATVPGDVVSTAQSSKKMLAVRGPGADVGGFTNIGQIAGNAASYACEQSGAYGISDTIGTLASQACSDFLKTLPGAPVAEKAWNIWQSPSKPGADGNLVTTTFRWFYNTASAPPLTDTICQTAYQQLTSTFCQGKGDKGADTRGGEIKVGTGDDYVMIGLDPNDS